VTDIITEIGLLAIDETCSCLQTLYIQGTLIWLLSILFNILKTSGVQHIVLYFFFSSCAPYFDNFPWLFLSIFIARWTRTPYTTGTQVLVKGKQFLLLIRHTPRYSYIQSNLVTVFTVIGRCFLSSITVNTVTRLDCIYE
jgi:hypothetical protein